MRKLLFLLLNMIVMLGFSAPTDTVPTMMPPRPPQNCQFAPHIHLTRSEQMTLTNLVIFIRFADDPEFTESLAPIDQMFNDSTPNNISVLHERHPKFLHRFLSGFETALVLPALQRDQPRRLPAPDYGHY